MNDSIIEQITARNQIHAEACERFENGEFSSVSEAQAAILVERKVADGEKKGLIRSLFAFPAREKKLQEESQKLAEEKSQALERQAIYDSLNLDLDKILKKLDLINYWERELIPQKYTHLQELEQRIISGSSHAGSILDVCQQYLNLEELASRIPDYRARVEEELANVEKQIKAMEKEFNIAN